MNTILQNIDRLSKLIHRHELQSSDVIAANAYSSCASLQMSELAFYRLAETNESMVAKFASGDRCRLSMFLDGVEIVTLSDIRSRDVEDTQSGLCGMDRSGA